MKTYWAELADHHAELSEWFGKLADWHNIVSWRETDAKFFQEIEKEHFEIAKVYRLMAKHEEERERMRKSILTSLVLVILMLGLVAGLPARAQDNVPLATNTAIEAIQPIATLEPTAVVAPTVAPVETPAPVVVVEQPTDRTLYVIGLIVFVVITLGGQIISHRSLSGLTAALSKQVDNKQLLDEATQRYMQSSLSTQQYIQLATNIAGVLGQMIPGKDLAEVAHDFGEKVIAGTETLPTGGDQGIVG